MSIARGFTTVYKLNIYYKKGQGKSDEAKEHFYQNCVGTLTCIIEIIMKLFYANDSIVEGSHDILDMQ